jgi:hypothetical protein
MRDWRRTMRQYVSLRGAVAAAGAIVVASVARADAPTGPGAQYGYFDTSNLVIYDNFTHLTWERYPTTATFTFAEAVAHCDSLSLGIWSAGWRAPSYKELLTLVDEMQHREYLNGALIPKYIDSHAFYGTPIDHFYWTSSPSAVASNASAYTVDFGSGNGMLTLMRLGNYVRCVHDY